MTKQISLKAGIKKFGDGAINAIKKEINHMHLQDSFIPKQKLELTKKQLQNVCEVVNLIKKE